MTKDNGGAAFPTMFEGGKNNAESPWFEKGMTLRDYYAGQATESDIDKYREYRCNRRTTKHRFLWWTWEDVNYGWPIAKYTREQARYRFADAMIAARKEEE